MPVCTNCSSWMSLLFDKRVQTQEKTSKNGQDVTRRTALSIRQNSKECNFCHFITSEMEVFPERRNPELFKDKRELEITDDQTALISGNWKTYNFGGERGFSPILESIHFQIYKPTGNESQPWQYSFYLGNYPVCIEASELLIYTLKDKSPHS